MIIKDPDRELAIVFCGHGSRNSDYLLEVVRLKEILAKRLKTDIFVCFIEINKPSIEECIKEVKSDYKKVLIFPLLLFEGRHLKKDVNERIFNILGNINEDVILMDKLSLVDDIFPTINDIVIHKKSNQFDILVTSCSFSKNNKVKEELEAYTKKLSISLDIPKNIFHFVGDEKRVLDELNSLKNHSLKILLHPVFFFGGYLYKKNIDTFSKLLTTINLRPLSHYDKIIETIFRKLIVNI